MQHLFLNKKLSLLAKEKGFNELCFGYYGLSGTFYYVRPDMHRNEYDVDTNSPLYQQIIDWFREKHQIHIWAQPQTWDGIVYTANWCYKTDTLWTFHDAGTKEQD